VIARGGRVTAAGVGVFVGDNPENHIVHNEIFDLYYSGISVGSIQDFGPSQATGNVVEHNHVHDVGQGVLSDLAGICRCPCASNTLQVMLLAASRVRWGVVGPEGIGLARTRVRAPLCVADGQAGYETKVPFLLETKGFQESFEKMLCEARPVGVPTSKRREIGP